MSGCKKWSIISGLSDTGLPRLSWPALCFILVSHSCSLAGSCIMSQATGWKKVSRSAERSRPCSLWPIYAQRTFRISRNFVCGVAATPKFSTVLKMDGGLRAHAAACGCSGTRQSKNFDSGIRLSWLFVYVSWKWFYVSCFYHVYACVGCQTDACPRCYSSMSSLCRFNCPDFYITPQQRSFSSLFVFVVCVF